MTPIKANQGGYQSKELLKDEMHFNLKKYLEIE